MNNIFKGKTLLLTLAILLVVAGGVLTVSLLGSDTPPSEQPTTAAQSELTTTAKPEPTTVTVPEPSTAAEIEPTAPALEIKLDDELELVNVNAASDSGYGIATDSEFILSGLEKLEQLTAITLQRYIQVNPDYEFSLLKNNDGQFVLKFAEELPKAQIISVKLIDENGKQIKSWAFQTESDIRVTSAFPNNQIWVDLFQGIEVGFSAPNISPEEFKSHFEISPAVQGEFAKNGNTFIFAPTDSYTEDTDYTVTIKSGLKNESGQELKKDYIITFSTRYTNSVYKQEFYLQSNDAETFLPDDLMLIPIWSPSKELDYTVRIYRFDTAEDYLQALYARKQAQNRGTKSLYDTTTLGEPTKQYTIKPTPTANDYNYFLVLPEQLPIGNYLLEISAPYTDESGKPLLELCYDNRFIQVSTISSGIVAADDQVLVWLNDAEAGKPLSGASITIANDNAEISFKTDAQGVGTGIFPREALLDWINHPVKLSINAGNKSYCDVVLLSPSGSMDTQSYYSYLYTDRAVYHTSDTAFVFGYIAPRQRQELPKELFATLKINDATMQRVPVALDANGGFACSFSFKNYNVFGSNIIYLEDAEGRQYNSINLYIQQYENPLYVIETETDRLFYEFGDDEQIKGVLKIKVHFFDGTPASSLPMHFSMYGYENVDFSGEVVTDAYGEASIPFTFNNTYTNLSQALNYISYTVRNGKGSEESFWHDGSFPVFYRDIISEAEVEKDMSIRIAVSQIDTDGISERVQLYDAKNNKGKPSAGNEAYLTLYRSYYTKEQSGTQYDYILKQSVPTYRYTHHLEEIDSFSAISDEQGIITFDSFAQYMNDDNSYWYAEGTVKDNKGQPLYVYCSLGGNSSMDSERHYFAFTRAGQSDYSFAYFTDNETVEIGLTEYSGSTYEGQYLAVPFADSFLQYSIQSADESFTPAYSEEMIPSYQVVGFFFDGKHIFPVNELSAYYDPKERELDMELESEQQTLLPGGELALKVLVKDASGKPAADTGVLISIVDEAAFAVAEQYANIIANIYQRRYNPYIQYYVSYYEHDTKNGDSDAAEGGGEGESEYIRNDFTDTASFSTVTTDKNGIAELRVKMPDNLTTWRITAQAYNKKLQAGTKLSHTVVTQPFFVKPLFSDSYLEGDKASVTLRCFGSEINSQTPVDYTLTLRHGDKEEQFTTSSKAGDYAVIMLGELQKGSYTVSVEAKAGEYRDAVQQSFECVQKGVSIKLAESIMPEQIKELAPYSFPIRLSFQNGGFKQYNKLLTYLLNSSSYARAEHQLTRRFVAEAFGIEGSNIDTRTEWVQPYSRGLVLFNKENSENDYVASTSALAALAVPQYLHTEGLISYFYTIVNKYDTPASELAAAYMGLAALGEPVLLDIRYLLYGDWLSYDDDLWLLAGLALLNDMEQAEPLYQTMIADRLQRKEDALLGQMSFIPADDKSDSADYEVQFRTAMALLIAIAADKTEDANQMAAYLQSIEPDRYPYQLQLLHYAQNMPKPQAEEAVFSYMLNGGKHTETLKANDSFMINLSEEQLAQADFKTLSGELSCTAFYEGSADRLYADSKKELVKMDRKITAVKGDGGIGTLYLVTLTVKFDKNAPYGAYYIKDQIPAGCRFVELDERQYTENWHLGYQALQDISFYYPNISPDELSLYGGRLQMTTVRYYIRSILPGSYNCGSAVISSDSGIWGISAPGMLTVK